MYKVLLNLLLVVYLSFAMSCNVNEYNPLNVTFNDSTLAGSSNYVISAVYLEDKRIRDKYTDIFISADKDNIVLSICKEYEEPIEITLNERNRFQSLTKLMNQQRKQFRLTNFAKAQTTTYIIKSKEKVNLKFKAVGGEIINEDDEDLKNIFNVSNVFDLKIENTDKA